MLIKKNVFMINKNILVNYVVGLTFVYIISKNQIVNYVMILDITIKNMVRCGRRADKKSNKYDELNFVDYLFVKNLINNSNDKCYYCSSDLQYTYYTSNLGTIERLDNNLGHIKSNCVIACRTCNLSKIGNQLNN